MAFTIKRYPDPERGPVLFSGDGESMHSRVVRGYGCCDARGGCRCWRVRGNRKDKRRK